MDWKGGGMADGRGGTGMLRVAAPRGPGFFPRDRSPDRCRFRVGKQRRVEGGGRGPGRRGRLDRAGQIGSDAGAGGRGPEKDPRAGAPTC